MNETRPPGENFSSNRDEWMLCIRGFQAQIQDVQQHLAQLPTTPQHQGLTRSLSDIFIQLDDLIQAETTLASLSDNAPRPREAQWRALSVCLPVGVFSTDTEGGCTYINPRCEEIVGCKLEDSLGGGWIRFVHPDDRDRIVTPWIEDAKAGRPHEAEFRIVTPANQTRWLYARTAPIVSDRNHVIGHTGTIEDITKQKLAEEQIKASLHEKEALLKEIHHRVKNNLQIISSLIYLQSQRIDDPRVRQIFEDSQTRISSMALVHDTLYRSQDFAQVNLSEYVQTLTSNLFHTYRIQPESVKLRIDIDPGVLASLDKAIPCGLILNELMTNALKHGFNDRPSGEIRVLLKKHVNQICLSVENDGHELPESFELQKIQSMGLRLVNALVDQVNGQVEIQRSGKTRFKITFDPA